MNRTAPSALLSDEIAPSRPSGLGHAAWRPDHLLTRPERMRLRHEGKELNVYDVGARANFRAVMMGDAVDAPTTWTEFGKELALAAWPLAAPRQKWGPRRLELTFRRHGAGHFFAHDPAKVEQLRALTAELRLGLGEEPHNQRPEYIGGGRWEESDSDSDSERTVYDRNGP